MAGRFRTFMQLGTLWAGLTGLAAMTPVMAQDLVIASSAPVTSIDPHYHTLTPNESLQVHMFDRLISRSADGKRIPGLALSWTRRDDTTWEVKLRKANFTNGAPFTAEDVVYTLARVPRVKNSPASFQIYTRAVVGTEILDPQTILLKTAAPYPMLPADLSQVFIIPHGLGDDPTTEDFNNGKNAIGTGPYRFVSYKPGDRIEMERNDQYWGPKPHWKHVSYRIISNDAARTAALLAGDVGIIEFVPPSDLANLRKDPRVSLSEVVSNRSIFLWFDHSREGPTPFVTGPNGETLAKNPLKDLRVRQALSMAINRQGIVERVMENSAVPTAQYLRPGAENYVPDLKPTKYDPTRAKELLKEAGYPNGLRVTLHGPNDRYVNDAKIIQAVAQMWQRIGVQTTVEGLPWSNYIARAGKQEFSIFLLGWGVSSGEGTNPLRAQMATWNPKRGMGTANRGRYSNPTVDALLDKALVTMDDGARDKIVQEAMRTAMADTPVIELHLQKNIWATRKGLTYEARVDEETQAMAVKPVK
ncbi:MAG: ABC transporter substrate-binding protein [Acetobacteraceae bacterium]